MDHRVWGLCVLVACGAPETVDSGAVRADFGNGLTGVGEAPPVDTDQLPVYRLFAGARALEIDAVDAVVDTDTETLAWIDPQGALWVAPLADAPAGKRQVAAPVIPGLAAHGGRVAFSVREVGPETAPFAVDLRAWEMIALADAPGPDEVLAFSPDGRDVLVLSGRTGLASLFALGVGDDSVRQLTNVGLAPGRDLDRARFTPPPADIHAVAWTARGVAYRAEQRAILIRPEVVR